MIYVELPRLWPKSSKNGNISHILVYIFCVKTSFAKFANLSILRKKSRISCTYHLITLILRFSYFGPVFASMSFAKFAVWADFDQNFAWHDIGDNYLSTVHEKHKLPCPYLISVFTDFDVLDLFLVNYYLEIMFATLSKCRCILALWYTYIFFSLNR